MSAAHQLNLNIDATWCDKYRPHSFEECLLHSQLNHELKVHTHDAQARQQLPHVLLTGPPGSGKRTRALCLIAALFKISRREIATLYKSDSARYKTIMEKINKKVRNGVELPLDNEEILPDLRNVSVNVALTQARTEKCDKAKDGIQVLHSPVHIEMTPSDVNFCDTKIIQQTLKNLFSSNERKMSGLGALQSLNLYENTMQSDDSRNLHVNPHYRVVVFNHFDRMSTDAQTAMRRIMEDYSKVARFILIATSIDHVIAPIQSRCSVLAIPRPVDDEIATMLQSAMLRALPPETCTEEILSASKPYIEKVVSSADGNATRALILLQVSLQQHLNCRESLLQVFECRLIMHPDWLIRAKESIRQLCQIDLGSATNRHDFLCSTMCELLKRRVPTHLIVQFIDKNVRATITTKCRLMTQSIQDLLDACSKEAEDPHHQSLTEREKEFLVKVLTSANRELAAVCSDVSSACAFYHTRSQKSQFPVIHMNALMLTLVCIVGQYQNYCRSVIVKKHLQSVCRPFSYIDQIGKFLLGTTGTANEIVEETRQNQQRLIEEEKQNEEAEKLENASQTSTFQMSRSDSVAKEMNEMCLDSNESHKINWKLVERRMNAQNINVNLLTE